MNNGLKPDFKVKIKVWLKTIQHFKTQVLAKVYTVYGYPGIINLVSQ